MLDNVPFPESNLFCGLLSLIFVQSFCEPEELEPAIY